MFIIDLYYTKIHLLKYVTLQYCYGDTLIYLSNQGFFMVLTQQQIVIFLFKNSFFSPLHFYFLCVLKFTHAHCRKNFRLLGHFMLFKNY